MLPQNVSIYYLIRYALARLEPESEKKEQAQRKSAAAAVLRRLDRSNEEGDEAERDEHRSRPRKEDIALNQYEQMIAMEVVAPEDIPVTFNGKTVPSSRLNFLTTF